MPGTALVPKPEAPVAKVQAGHVTIQWFWHADMHGEVTTPVGADEWKNFWLAARHYLHTMGVLPDIRLVRVEATY